MEDTLKGNNSTLAEKPITAADIHETWPGREVVSLLQHGLASGLKLMWFQLFFSVALMIVFLVAFILVLTRIPSTGNIAAPDSKVAGKSVPAPEAALPATIPEPLPSTTALSNGKRFRVFLISCGRHNWPRISISSLTLIPPRFPISLKKKKGS